MTNKPKAKGTGWETEIVDYLNSFPFPDKAERTGSADFGAADIHMGDWVFEAKAEVKIDLPGYLKQLKTAVERNKFFAPKAAVLIKNRRHSVQDGYAVMTIEEYRRLMAYVAMLESATSSVTGTE